MNDVAKICLGAALSFMTLVAAARADEFKLSHGGEILETIKRNMGQEAPQAVQWVYVSPANVPQYPRVGSTGVPVHIGSYEVTAIIQRTPYATIYDAQDPSGRPVVIKQPDLGHVDEQEASLLRRVSGSGFRRPTPWAWWREALSPPS